MTDPVDSAEEKSFFLLQIFNLESFKSSLLFQWQTNQNYCNLNEPIELIIFQLLPHTSSEHVHVVDPLEHLVVDVLLLGALPLQAALLIDICTQVFTTCKATF